ncbi:MAG: polysaccharide deacetylase family protein [Limnohabitans sp.]
MTILTFHRVSNEPDVLWPPMRVYVFERMMAFLAKETAVVSLESLPWLGTYPDKPLVCISFDDGYLDFYENALPILQKYGLPCHHNICPGLIDAGKLPWTADVSHYLIQHLGMVCITPAAAGLEHPEFTR